MLTEERLQKIQELVEERKDELDQALESIGKDDQMPDYNTDRYNNQDRADYEEMVYGEKCETKGDNTTKAFNFTLKYGKNIRPNYVKIVCDGVTAVDDGKGNLIGAGVYGDVKRIQHFCKVHSYAKLIAETEGVDPKTLFILEAAALTHDIGIHICEQKYGNCNGKLQEISFIIVLP